MSGGSLSISDLSRVIRVSAPDGVEMNPYSDLIQR